MDALPQSEKMKCAETVRFPLMEKTIEIEPCLTTTSNISCELDLEVQSIGLIANKLGRGDT